MLVTRVTQEHTDLLGAQLIGIGEKSLAEVESALRPIVQSDNPQAQDYLLPSFMVVPEMLAARIGLKGDHFIRLQISRCKIWSGTTKR